MKSRKCVTVVEFYRGAVWKLLEFEKKNFLERHYDSLWSQQIWAQSYKNVLLVWS